MSAFPNWKQFVVPQKRPDTGCIPWSFEIILRAANTSSVDLATFQDDFDLQAKGIGDNNFSSIADAVKNQYPHICFVIEKFPQGDGHKKLQSIEGRLSKQLPTLVSLTLTPSGGWHIMPVVDATTSELILLHSVDATGNPNICKFLKTEFVRRHDQWPGGDDIAYLA